MSAGSEDQSAEDRELDALVLRAFESQAGPVRKPETEVILAYLSGTATDREQNVVREALLRSGRFREEFMEIAEEFDAVFGVEEAAADPHPADAPRPGHHKHEEKERWLWAGVWAFLVRPSVAYGVAAVFLFLWVFVPGLVGPSREAVVGSAELLDLSVVPEGERVKSITIPQVTATSGYIVLKLALPIRFDSTSRFSVLVDPEIGSSEKIDQLVIVNESLLVAIPLKNLQPGEHTVRVEGKDGQSERVWVGTAAFRVVR